MKAGLTDAQRRYDLRRMKVFATGLLVLAAVVWWLSRQAIDGGAGAWAGYVKAGAEAGMIGGLADWFAVTALFRHPLGLPIPHTAIVPTRKDQLGASLGEFVGVNFLSDEVVRDKVGRAELARRVGTWLADPAHARRVTDELATATRAAIGVLRDEDVQAVMEQTVLKRLDAVQVGPPLGRVLHGIVDDRGHKAAVDLLVANAHEWLFDNRDIVVGQVAAQAPTWAPRAVNEVVAGRVWAELVRVAGDVRANPEHPWRRTVDTYLHRLASDLQTDPDTIDKAQSIKAQVLDHPEVRAALGDIWAAVRRIALEMVDDPAGELRARVTEGIAAFGRRLVDDGALRAKADAWAQSAVHYVVSNYRSEITSVITDTVERWDAAETTAKIELQVGRDLQFIRVNGFVVGTLAGLVIHAVGALL